MSERKTDPASLFDRAGQLERTLSRCSLLQMAGMSGTASTFGLGGHGNGAHVPCRPLPPRKDTA